MNEQAQERHVSLAVIIGAGLFLICFSVLYAGTIAKLVHDWYMDDNYSHGFLIVPLAAYFAWERREKFAKTPVTPSLVGALIVFGSVLCLVAGVLGSELFLPRVSIIGTIAGSVLFLYGWARLKIMLFPILILILMVPIPAIIFNQIAFPLQLLASRFGEMGLLLFRIPVLREGNVIHMANTSLEVAEACSGIRSLISLLTLGLVYGYFTDSRSWYRLVLAVATIPIAIAANGFRVAGTGIAAHFYGPGAAEGFFHSFSGWIIFLAAFVMLFVLQRLLLWLAPARKQVAESTAVGA